jgi:hypothetical protein
MADDHDACLCALDHRDPLRAVLQGTASETGERFFEVLVTSLSSALKTRYAWVTELQGAPAALEDARLLHGRALAGAL